MLLDNGAEHEAASPAERYQLWFGIIVTIVAVFLCVLGGWAYPLDQQQDSGLHFRIIQSLMESGTYSSYVGVYYYGLIVLAIQVFAFLGIVSDVNLVQAGVTFVNSCCLTGFVAGVYFLARGLFSRRSTAWLLVAACATIPILQGQFRFVRPENFLLLASLWSMVAFFAFMRHPARRGLLITSGLVLALAITQKISGLVVAAGLVVLYFCYRKARIDFKVLATLVIFSALPSFAYWVAHYNYTGIWFFQNDVRHMGDTYDHTPDVDIFLRVNPVDAWQNPRRNGQRDSMANIFLLDLYGDYWEYRYSLPEFASARGIEGQDDYLNYITWRARVGLILACCFIAASLGALSYFVAIWKRGKKEALWKPAGWFVAILLSHAYLVAAGYSNSYKPDDFNLVKWDYICWVLLFWLIPICLVADDRRSARGRYVARAVLVLLIAGGLMQSIY